MISIYKYPFPDDASCDHVNIVMPKGARILSVGIQARRICLWALVNTTEPTETRRFRIALTGDNAMGVINATFLGHVTVGDYELHVFDLGGPA